MSDRDDLKAGRYAGQHSNTRVTRELTYERARSVGMSRDEARRTAEKITTDVHRRMDRSGKE